MVEPYRFWITVSGQIDLVFRTGFRVQGLGVRTGFRI